MAFVSLGLLELIHVFNIRSEKSIFCVGTFNNPYLLGAFVLGTILQVSVVVIPKFASIFQLRNLTMQQWLYTIFISVIPVVIMELQKALNITGKRNEVNKKVAVEKITV